MWRMLLGGFSLTSFLSAERQCRQYSIFAGRTTCAVLASIDSILAIAGLMNVVMINGEKQVTKEGEDSDVQDT